MAVLICSRTGDVVEPLARPQWFLRTEQLASQTPMGRSAVENILVKQQIERV